MKSRTVWLATLAVAGVVLTAGVACAQYRGYGYDDRGAADYYYGGPFGGGYYDDPGNGAYGAPSGLPPRRYRDEGYDPRDPGEGGGPPPAPGPDYGYGGGYDQGPSPYVEPRDGGRDYGAEPGRRASDLDLQEGSQETTRTEVENTTGQKPGTIVINTAERHLYFVEPNGQALRYGIGVGRQGFAWKGTAQVKRKSEWPDWIPPSDMLKRRPDLPTRMAGGIDNPLGARAMYLFQGNKDTMFRIHGTNEPDSIGKAMSSGCIRMMNKDVIDLYSRVPVGTKVVVL